MKNNSIDIKAKIKRRVHLIVYREPDPRNQDDLIDRDLNGDRIELANVDLCSPYALYSNTELSTFVLKVIFEFLKEGLFCELTLEGDHND